MAYVAIARVGPCPALLLSSAPASAARRSGALRDMELWQRCVAVSGSDDAERIGASGSCRLRIRAPCRLCGLVVNRCPAVSGVPVVRTGQKETPQRNLQLSVRVLEQFAVLPEDGTYIVMQLDQHATMDVTNH